ncbi:dnaJ-like protein 60 isoform X1 [Papilio machaon]|uniref:dnaJ-like protein 60 isoform X1 n=2 Tax=Papilio machaon TaxID=76193 RepID=UPI001E663733|nr:dnaJ-like protein 60 isoform X1 [Papilio machaon]
MFLLKRPDLKVIYACTRLYSFGRRSHYDVLNLRKNCTDKEIKDAYIRLSKQYHPDKNKNARAQEQFVQVQEAYNVLSKPGSRAQYDSTIDIDLNSGYVYRTHVAYNSRNNPYYGFTQQTSKTRTDSNSYYGVKGVKKLPNTAIIVLCFGIAFVGVLLQFIVIRNSYLSHRRQIQERSMMCGDELDKVRAAAQGKSNEMQTRIMLEKIVAASNPTAATASLGQALANDKKKLMKICSRCNNVKENGSDCLVCAPKGNDITYAEVVKKITSYLY